MITITLNHLFLALSLSGWALVAWTKREAILDFLWDLPNRWEGYFNSQEELEEIWTAASQLCSRLDEATPELTDSSLVYTWRTGMRLVLRHRYGRHQIQYAGRVTYIPRHLIPDADEWFKAASFSWFRNHIADGLREEPTRTVTTVTASETFWS